MTQQEITLVWKVTNQHIETFTPERFAEWVESARLDVDPTDLDAVYEALQDGWRGQEWLLELAGERNWVDADPSDVELSDLTSSGGAA